MLLEDLETLQRSLQETESVRSYVKVIPPSPGGTPERVDRNQVLLIACMSWGSLMSLEWSRLPLCWAALRAAASSFCSYLKAASSSLTSFFSFIERESSTTHGVLYLLYNMRMQEEMERGVCVSTSGGLWKMKESLCYLRVSERTRPHRWETRDCQCPEDSDKRMVIPSRASRLVSHWVQMEASSWEQGLLKGWRHIKKCIDFIWKFLPEA